MRELLAKDCQACIDQGCGIGHIVNAVTFVFDSNIDVIPQSVCFRFGEAPGNDSTRCIKHASGSQRGFESSDFGIKCSLGTIHVEVRGSGVAGDAGGYVRQEGVVFAVTHVAGNAGILDRRVMRAGRTSNGTRAADTHQHVALWAVVRAKACGNCDCAISSGCGNIPTSLVAVGAQVALAAVEGLASSDILYHRGRSGQGEVRIGVGGVDRVAGAAILLGGVRISNRFVGGEARREICDETAT